MAVPKVFMIMPFKEEFFEVYDLLKERFADEFEFTHAGDDVDTQQNILKDIVQMIYDADIVIADLSGLNANVFFELGVAHTLGKKTITISQDLRQLPFDIRSYRATEYSTHFKKFEHLVKELTRYLKGAVNGSVAFGNPVVDFLSTVGANKLPELSFDESSSSVTLADSGIIDYLADIEKEMNCILASVSDITDSISTMSSGINTCTSEIDRVKKGGGSGTAAFMKKQSRKAASFINSFSLNLRKHNEVFLEKWPIFEQNCLLLLENKHASTPENKEGLIEFLKSLYEMKETSTATKRQIGDFAKTFADLRGIQSSLNQAVNSIEIDVSQFISFIEQMCASVERILEKSRFVVGDIDYTDDSSK